MQFSHYGEDPVRLAVALANDPPQTLGAFRCLMAERDLELPRRPTRADLTEVHELIRQWLAVADAKDEVSRARRLNDLLACHASYPRLTDHRGTGWHLHFHDDECDAAHLVSVLISVGTALHLVNRGMHRLGRCAADDCERVWADFSRAGTQRYCSPRCANTEAVRRHRTRGRETPLKLLDSHATGEGAL